MAFKLHLILSMLRTLLSAQILLFCVLSFAESLQKVPLNFKPDAPYSEENLLKLVQLDIDTIARLKFSKSNQKFKSFFGDSLEGKTVAEWIRKNVKQVIAGRPGFAYGGTGGCHKITLGQDYYRQPQLHRMGVIVHEALHAASCPVHKQHVFCPVPYTFQYKNNVYRINDLDDQFKNDRFFLGCDKDDEGPYSINAAFILNIAEYCENCVDVEWNLAANIFIFHGILKVGNQDAALKLVRELGLEKWFEEKALPQFEKLP